MYSPHVFRGFSFSFSFFFDFLPTTDVLRFRFTIFLSRLLGSAVVFSYLIFPFLPRLPFFPSNAMAEKAIDRAEEGEEKENRGGVALMEADYLTKRTMTSSRFKFIGNSISIVAKYPMLRFFSFYLILPPLPFRSSLKVGTYVRTSNERTLVVEIPYFIYL